MHAVYRQQMFNKTVDLINVGCGVHLQMQTCIHTLHAPSLFLKLKYNSFTSQFTKRLCINVC